MLKIKYDIEGSSEKADPEESIIDRLFDGNLEGISEGILDV